MNTFKRWVVRFVPLVAVAGPAFAAPPAVSFLTPDRHMAALGESLTLRFDAGAAKDAQPAPWPSDRIAWLFVRGGPTQENRENVQPARAQDNFVTVEVKHPGVTLVGVDQRPTVSEMTAAELRAFVERNVAGGAPIGKLPAGKDNLRVRQVASAKTLIRVPAADGSVLPSAIATSKTGQAVELRPLFDPTAIEVGSDLPLWVYVAGSKQGGVKVQATNVATGKTSTFLTDQGGSGHFSVTEAGLWRVEAHHAEPLPDDSVADWVLYSATLTFEVATKGAKP